MKLLTESVSNLTFSSLEWTSSCALCGGVKERGGDREGETEEEEEMDGKRRKERRRRERVVKKEDSEEGESQ